MQSSSVVVAERHERDDVDRPDARVLARCGRPCRSRGSRRRAAARAPRTTGPCSPASVKTERLWLASLVRSSRNDAVDARDGLGEAVDDVEPAALGDVGDGFDEHGSMLSLFPWSRNARGAGSAVEHRDADAALAGDLDRPLVARRRRGAGRPSPDRWSGRARASRRPAACRRRRRPSRRAASSRSRRRRRGGWRPTTRRPRC